MLKGQRSKVNVMVRVQQNDVGSNFMSAFLLYSLSAIHLGICWAHSFTKSLRSTVGQLRPKSCKVVVVFI